MTEQNQQQNPGRQYKISTIIWVLVLTAALGYYYVYNQPRRLALPYSDFKQKISEGSIAEITIKGQRVTGSFKDAVKKGSGNDAASYERFRTAIPPVDDRELLDLLEQNDVIVHVTPETKSWFGLLLLNVLPWVLIIGLFIYGSRKMQQRMGGGGPGGGMFGFGKSKAKLYQKTDQDITFDDVAGARSAKKELTEVVEYLKDPRKFNSLGGTLPKGMLLVGPPGTGKTLLARAVAGEARVPFYIISGSEFVEMFVGVGASRVRDMFSSAKQNAPAIIFIDEIDSIGRVRGTGVGGGHDEREQTLNQILSEMDGFSPRESIVVIAATNRPDVLDPALLRPGRFDRRVVLELPHKDEREEILKIHTENIPLADGIQLGDIAKMTVGFSGADLQNLANEAALLAARKSKKQVEMDDFEDSIDKLMLGLKRENVFNEEEKRIVAYHEAGHTLVAKLLRRTDPLKKVTIIPRSRSLGVTEQIPDEDRHNLGKEYLQHRIAIMLGGRSAEKIMFSEVTTGASNDLENATKLARRMICNWGMSEKLGPVTFHQGGAHPFLGREMTEPKQFSERTAQHIDEEIRSLISTMEQKAFDILSHHRAELNALAQALLERETLEQDDIDDVLDAARRQQEEASGS